jgi:allantoinase
MSFDFIVRSKCVVTPEATIDAGIAIRGETIVGILPSDQIRSGDRVVDAGDAMVLPGLVDTHIHINEPGRTEWEGFETATRAAAAGGVTTLVDMPLNSSPVTTTADALDTKVRAARGRIWVDCGFWGGLIPSNAGSIGSLLDAGVVGVKAFLVDSGIDEFPMASEEVLRKAMPILARYQLPLLVHAEETLAGGTPARMPDDARRYQTYLASRPPEMELNAARRMVRLGREFGCPVHVVHLSAAGVLAESNRARSQGLRVTVETCPHYLLLAAEEIPDGRTEFKCAPPIRERENRERLWRALGEGAIDMVVSDHSPCTPALKLTDSGDFLRAWGGISSIQFGLSLLWTNARRRGFSIQDVSRWMSAAPARLAGFANRKGVIAPGYDADLVVIDPDAGFTLEPGMIQYRHPLTPYLGQRLEGRVQMTFLRGRKVYEGGHFFGPPPGQTLLRPSPPMNLQV